MIPQSAMNALDPVYRINDVIREGMQAHREIAAEANLSCEIIDSFRLHDDVDEVEDLVEVLTLGSGSTRRYLERLGFALSTEGGRVGVKRHPHE